MSDTKPLSEGINDPATYRRLSEPFASVDEAEKAWMAFAAELRELRAKHRIADLLAVAGISFIAADGEESWLPIVLHNGDEMKAETLAAYAFGAEQANRQERIARALQAKPSIKNPKRTK